MTSAGWGTEVVAHRGASAYAPEHTFAAFDLALELGADGLELDLRATADGAVVVLHDPTLARTAGDPRAVAELTTGELARLDPASRPLTLEAVLGRFGDATHFLLELKDTSAASVRGVAAAVARARLTDHVVVQAFDALGLRRIRRIEPRLRVAPLFATAPPPEALAAIAGYAAGIGLCRTAVGGGVVPAAHALGLAVRVYTVNDPAELRELASAGVDGLITDVPDRARTAVDAVAGRRAAA